MRPDDCAPVEARATGLQGPVMAGANANTARARDIIRGSGNVFADLNFPDAEQRQTKLRLAYALNTILDEQRLTQTAAATRLGLNQPKISALRNYKLEGFSVERLLALLNARELSFRGCEG